jgi:ABC-type uncharacterized transport system ATPase subunit
LKIWKFPIPKAAACWAAWRSSARRTVVDRIHKVAAEISLKDCLEVEGAFLSHGQKQWLEIGMLLMQEPELVMLDEPVAGMSPAEREQTAAFIQRICKGRCIVVIEHDMEFVSPASPTKSPCCISVNCWPRAAWRKSATTQKSLTYISATEK